MLPEPCKYCKYWRFHERVETRVNVSFMETSLVLQVLRAILANAPNSIPPERVFSILNNTFGDDQDRALADYIELALQLQFNERSRSQEAV